MTIEELTAQGWEPLTESFNPAEEWRLLLGVIRQLEKKPSVPYELVEEGGYVYVWTKPRVKTAP